MKTKTTAWLTLVFFFHLLSIGLTAPTWADGPIDESDFLPAEESDETDVVPVDDLEDEQDQLNEDEFVEGESGGIPDTSYFLDGDEPLEESETEEETTEEIIDEETVTEEETVNEEETNTEEEVEQEQQEEQGEDKPIDFEDVEPVELKINLLDANNKKIGEAKGLFILSDDGDELIAIITKEGDETLDFILLPDGTITSDLNAEGISSSELFYEFSGNSEDSTKRENTVNDTHDISTTISSGVSEALFDPFTSDASSGGGSIPNFADRSPSLTGSRPSFAAYNVSSGLGGGGGMGLGTGSIEIGMFQPAEKVDIVGTAPRNLEDVSYISILSSTSALNPEMIAALLKEDPQLVQIFIAKGIIKLTDLQQGRLDEETMALLASLFPSAEPEAQNANQLVDLPLVNEEALAALLRDKPFNEWTQKLDSTTLDPSAFATAFPPQMD